MSRMFFRFYVTDISGDSSIWLNSQNSAAMPFQDFTRTISFSLSAHFMQQGMEFGRSFQNMMGTGFYQTLPVMIAP